MCEIEVLKIFMEMQILCLTKHMVLVPKEVNQNLVNGIRLTLQRLPLHNLLNQTQTILTLQVLAV